MIASAAILSTQCGPSPADNDIEIHRGQNLVWSRGANVDSAWDSADMTPLPGLGLVQTPSPCPFDVCYGDIHQCGGAPCNDTTLSCPLYERCAGGGNNQIGTCKRISP